MRPHVEKFRSGITRTTDQPCDGLKPVIISV